MENKNTCMETAMELNIESWKKVGIPIPEAYRNWCMEHGREDLLDGNKPNLSAESAFLPVPSRQELAEMFGLKLGSDISSEALELPTTEEDINAMLNLALETMARDLGIKLPQNIANESMDIDPNGELPSMEEIFGLKLKE
jgi:hypothetical protein